MRKAINLILIITFALSSIFAVEVKGKVKYVGKPPKAKRLRMDADPVCAASHREAARAESFIVDADGNLANVIVYLEGVSYSGKAPTKPVVLDQSGCIYSPHVVGLRAGQPLKILNSDATMHNIHGLPKVNREFNFGMPKSLKEKSVTFEKAESVFVVKCDVHPWMKSYAQVFDHPYFAVTDDSGSYTISGLAPGKYVLEAWHEKLGLQTVDLSVDESGATQNFTFTKPKKK